MNVKEGALSQASLNTAEEQQPITLPQSDASHRIADLLKRSLACVDRRDYAKALAYGQQILALDPQHEAGIHLVGLSLLRLGDHTQALPLLERTTNAKPLNGLVHWQFAQTLAGVKQYDRAITHFDRAQVLGVVDDQLDQQRYDIAAHAFKRHCHWIDYDRIQRLVRQSVLSSGRWIVGESTLASPYFTSSTLLKATQHHAKNVLASVGQTAAFEHTPPKQKIRIGFVGCDFFEQATAYLMVGFIEALNREHFEVFAYEHGPDHKATDFRIRVIKAYDHLIRIDDLSDQAAAERIHQDQIDILYSIKNPASARLGIFARRPAAIQIHYLYYPGTSGMPFFDYIIGDDIVTPIGAESLYAEKILRLSSCYQPNDSFLRLKAEDTPRHQWGLPEDAIVLANFNQTYKYTPDMFDLWCQLLSRDDKRVLWLLAENPEIQQCLTVEAKSRGIASDRLYFASKVTTQPYLNRLRQADLILDTFPYGGHTLTSDALWSGTPVVTLCGETYASRVAASLLHDVGMDELVAYSEQEYLDKAEALLNDPHKRQHWCNHLDQGRAQFSLFDSTHYARKFEVAAKQVVYERWNRVALPVSDAEISTLNVSQQ
jgi:protein O-GlcNAc transferase